MRVGRAKARIARETIWAAERGETRAQYLKRRKQISDRRRRGLRRGGSVEELQAIAAQSNVQVTQCPPGIHCGWKPSYLR